MEVVGHDGILIQMPKYPSFDTLITIKIQPKKKVRSKSI